MTAVRPGNDTFFTKLVSFTLLPLFAIESPEGANSSLYGATSPDAKAGGFYGPSGFLGMNGAVAKLNAPNPSKDLEVAKKLWELSQELTHVNWG
jgi:hypothetical protein